MQQNCQKLPKKRKLQNSDWAWTKTRIKKSKRRKRGWIGKLSSISPSLLDHSPCKNRVNRVKLRKTGRKMAKEDWNAGEAERRAVTLPSRLFQWGEVESRTKKKRTTWNVGWACKEGVLRKTTEWRETNKSIGASVLLYYYWIGE